MSDLYADTVRWWGYLRVSTSAQALDGYGLDTQLEGIRTWVAGNGGRLAGHSKDAGASGALDLDQRDGLLDAVFQCQRNGYKGIVVYRLDRLSRDPVGLEMILRERPSPTSQRGRGRTSSRTGPRGTGALSISTPTRATARTFSPSAPTPVRNQ